MSLVKHMMEERYALYSIASDILERVGAIKICKVHEERYLADESKLRNAYKLGNSLISKQHLNCNRRELTDAIKDILDHVQEECSYCAYVKYDDD